MPWSNAAHFGSARGNADAHKDDDAYDSSQNVYGDACAKQNIDPADACAIINQHADQDTRADYDADARAIRHIDADTCATRNADGDADSYRNAQALTMDQENITGPSEDPKEETLGE